MSKIPYREAIGSLMWAALAIQPDIAFAVLLLSQFLKNPGEIHWNTVKRVMRYLSGTKNYKLTLGKNCDGLLGYTDADWASVRDYTYTQVTTSHNRTMTRCIYQW